MIVEVGRLSSQIFGGLQVHAAHQMEASLGVQLRQKPNMHVVSENNSQYTSTFRLWIPQLDFDSSVTCLSNCIWRFST